MHKNLWGILLICTKKPQENREGSGRTLKKLDNSSRCARMRQGKGGNELVKTFWDVGIMVKVPISTGKMPDSHQIPGRKRPFCWWILSDFPWRTRKMVGTRWVSHQTHFLQKLYEKRTDKVGCAAGFYPRRKCSKKGSLVTLLGQRVRHQVQFSGPDGQDQVAGWANWRRRVSSSPKVG